MMENVSFAKIHEILSDFILADKPIVTSVVTSEDKEVLSV